MTWFRQFSLFKQSGSRRAVARALALGLTLGVAACGGSGDYLPYPDKGPDGTVNPNPTGERQTIFGSGGLFSPGSKKPEEGGGGGIGVNSFLWRASLDTISFMPLASADPFGGVIITDWYAAPQTPNERFKVTIYILDRALRADGIRVSVFRQLRQGEGWADQATASETNVSMENAILQRARELRVEAEARR
ncbi:DUF3576 domain-containing protein [Ferrovibrio sp.]|uniref:DUF3576 domain-containing protein n=1 Tax=Ferrovibrio sp. TaxID=1917215 RepID=UPI003D2DF07E